MCTDQNYVGKGNYANDSEQSVNATLSTLAAENRLDEASQYISVNRQVYEAQTKLLTLVGDFMEIGNASQPVEVINDLLFRWLTSPSTDLALDANRTQLLIAQQLVNFLTELSERTASLNQVINQTSSLVDPVYRK